MILLLLLFSFSSAGGKPDDITVIVARVTSLPKPLDK